MFRRISLAYVALALTGVALLSVLPVEDPMVSVGDLGDHAGEEVAVEALVVGVEGDEVLLWEGGDTARAFGRTSLHPGDVAKVVGRVSMGRKPYLDIEGYRLLRKTRPVPVATAADDEWVVARGTLAPLEGGWGLITDMVTVPLRFHVDVTPVEGLPLEITGVYHGWTIHIHDRDCVSADRFMEAPWAVAGNVSALGLVAMEPRGAVLSLTTVDGSLRVVADGGAAHMGDLVRVEGPVVYDAGTARFSLVGSLTVMESAGPVDVAAADLFAGPWRYEGATVRVHGNVTIGGDGPSLVTACGPIPLRGNVTTGPHPVVGQFVLDGMGYVIDVTSLGAAG